MEDSSIIWLVPKDINKSQCLNIILNKKNNKVIEVIASEYQCIFGHRRSYLLYQLYQSSLLSYNSHNNENNSHNNNNNMINKQENITLELTEDEELDILPTLYYIHSELIDNIFIESSVLTLAKTAHFLQINHLCQYIIEEVSITLSYLLELSQDIGMLRISVWDAISILHLLGDNHNLLSYINLKEWCESQPEIFANETLYSSCRHIYSSAELASFVNEINQCYNKKIERLVECQESLLLEKQLKIKCLCDDLNILLENYIGKRITLKESQLLFQRCQQNNRNHCLTGTIVKVDPITCNELVIMWHNDASYTNIKISDLKRFDIT